MKGHETPRSPPPATRQEFRALQRAIASAGDAQAAQVVALIDALDDRTAFDGLLDPLRPRLARLRPSRPLRFTRLLFMPLDPVIVSAPDWRVGMLAVPRNALRPLAASAHALLGDRAAEIDKMIEGGTLNDTEIVARAGTILWPAASGALAQATMSADWAAAGLPGALHGPLAHDVAAVLDQASAIHAITAEVAAGLPQDDAAVETVLAAMALSGPDPWGLALAVMLERLPEPGLVLQQAIGWTSRRGEPQLRATVDRVVGTLLGRLEARSGAADLVGDIAEAGPRVKHLAKLIDGLSTDAMPKALQQRLEAARQRLDGNCRARFADSLTNEFLMPLQALRQPPQDQVSGRQKSGQPTANVAAVARLEVTARNLRSLEAEARQVNGAGMYDDLLRQTALVVRNMAPNAGLALDEKVRLVEILAGSDEALVLLA
jgi:hypothetical protein